MPPLPQKGDILDGGKLRELVENDAEFKKYIDAEFDELDSNHNGKLSKEELRPAILKIAELSGLPPPGTKQEADALVEGVFQSLYNKDLDSELDRETFAAVSRDILYEIATGLQEDPLLVAVVDGSALKELLSDKEEFAAMAESMFTELDADKSGKLDRKELKTAVQALGLDQQSPSAEGESIISDVLAKYAHGEQLLDKDEFTKLLTDVLVELADTLAAKPIYIAHDVKVLNGAPIRKLLNNEELLQKACEEMFQEWDTSNDGKLSKGEVAEGFRKLGLAFGLPPPESQEKAEALYAAVFDAADYDHSGFVDKAEFAIVVKALFTNIAALLEENPIIVESTIISS